MEKMLKERNVKFHYGFVVVAGCFFISVYAMGLTINIFSTYLPSIITEDGLTKTQGSFIIALQNIVSVVTMLLANKIYRRVSIRLVVYICGIAMAAGYLIYSVSDSFSLYLAGAATIGLAYGCGGIVAISVLINKWFDAFRGRALAISIIGTSVASIIFPPVISRLIIIFGLSETFVIQAGIVFAFATVSFITIRNTPEELGLTPYGYTGDHISEDTRPLYVSRPYKEILLSRNFLIIFYCALVAGSTTLSTIPHFTVILVEAGYDTIFAASMFSLYGSFGFLGKLIFGTFADKLGIKNASLYVFTVWSLALLLIIFFTPAPVTPYLYAVLIGLAIPIGTIPLPIWAGDFFCKEEYLFVITVTNSAMHIGGSILSALPGAVADVTGSYRSVFPFYLAATLLALILLHRLYAKKRQES